MYSPLQIFHTSLVGTGGNKWPTITPPTDVAADAAEGASVERGRSFLPNWGQDCVAPTELRAG